MIGKFRDSKYRYKQAVIQAEHLCYNNCRLNERDKIELDRLTNIIIELENYFEEVDKKYIMLDSIGNRINIFEYINKLENHHRIVFQER